MKIAICADSHDNLVNISKFLHYCNTHEVETILHCGDWCAPSTLKYFRESFSGAIYGVYGNVHDTDKIMKQFGKETKIKLKEDTLNVKIEKFNILITHYPDKAKRLAKNKKYHFIFYGHNHKPWKEVIEKTYVVNPGTLAGMFYNATFALYDTKTRKLELIILDQIKNVTP